MASRRGRAAAYLHGALASNRHRAWHNIAPRVAMILSKIHQKPYHDGSAPGMSINIILSCAANGTRQHLPISHQSAPGAYLSNGIVYRHGVSPYRSANARYKAQHVGVSTRRRDGASVLRASVMTSSTKRVVLSLACGVAPWRVAIWACITYGRHVKHLAASC